MRLVPLFRVIIPKRLAIVSGRLPILSTRYRPTNVNMKLTAATRADSHTADWSLLTPAIRIIVAL